jgi:hypothetical protein
MWLAIVKVIFWGSCVIFWASPQLVFSLACSSTATSSPLPLPSQAIVCTHCCRWLVTVLPHRYCRMDHVFQWEGNNAKWHQNNGVTRVDGVSRDTEFLSHPRIGRSWRYNIPLHQMMVDLYQAQPMPSCRCCHCRAAAAATALL